MKAKLFARSSMVLGMALAAYVCGIVTAPVAHAQWAVIDATNLQQALLRYGVLLKQYSTELNQEVTSTEQLTQQINIYEQALTAYNEVLRQMQGLQNQLSPQDYQSLLSRYSSILSTGPAQPGWMQANQEVGQLYYRGQTPQQMQGVINQLPISGTSSTSLTNQTNQIEQASQLASSQRATYDNMEQLANERGSRLQQIETDRSSLGPEDNLKTQQVIAEQNSVQLDMLQQIVRQNDAQMLYANQQDNRLAAQKAEDQEAEINAMQKQLGTQITITNSGSSGQ